MAMHGSSTLDSRFLAWFLIGVAAVMQLSRIVSITAPHGELPFLSANDRSRWCAIAALTEEGRWEIDKYIELLDSKGKSRIWSTIDLVRHRGADGQEHSYSSKPPLLTLMYAAVCKPITWLSGKKLTEEPFLIGRWVMIVANLIPLIVWWIWFSRWLESHVVDAWSRWMLLNMAIWGSFLTTFVATLNNHLHGALFFTVSLALAWQIIRESRQGLTSTWGIWLSLGVSVAMTVACELPALAWAAAIGAIVFVADWKRMLLGFGIGSAMIAAAFLGTNFWAHGDWRPPYAHRGLGAEIGTLEGVSVDSTPTLVDVRGVVDPATYAISDAAQILPARLEGVWQVVDDTTKARVALKPNGDRWTVYAWDDWYDYPKSYWLPENKKGVDRGEPDRWKYVLHFTLGHHGVFSLTPFWLWSLAGACLWIFDGKRSPTDSAAAIPGPLAGFRNWVLSDQAVALALLAVTLACGVFYASRDVVDRNYAGVCSGFRWLFWLIPAWLWLSTPAVQWTASHRWARMALYVAIGISILSATIPWPNPWTHPWPYRLLMWMYRDSYQ